ncbi:MAG: hypothetical protein JO206_05635 [Solirubrobacterales bacterium]|nr:hypothetical protein [Solirubrobacterales bacterium]
MRALDLWDLLTIAEGRDQQVAGSPCGAGADLRRVSGWTGVGPPRAGVQATLRARAAAPVLSARR